MVAYLPLDSIDQIDMMHLLMSTITTGAGGAPENTINAVKARKRFGELLDKTDYRGESFLVKRSGKLKAAIVSIQDYEFIKRRNTARQRLSVTHGQMEKSFAKLGPKKTQALIDKAVKEVRVQAAE